MRTDRNTDVEVIAAEQVQRRQRTKQERREIAEESLQPGVSVAVLARRHGINANQVFHWRKLFREGRLEPEPVKAQLIPVRLSEVIEDKPAPVLQRPGVIQVELGGACVRVEGAADPATLKIILERLGR